MSIVFRAHDPRITRLTVPLYSHVAAKEFVLLYPVYALLFAEHGLSVSQIGSLLALWSGIGLVSGVPAGALADVIPRRYVLAVAPLLTAAAFSLWLLTPGYASFATGFALWGVSGSLTSGAMEALIHDELAHRGAVDRYARVMGVTRALEVGGGRGCHSGGRPRPGLDRRWFGRRVRGYRRHERRNLPAIRRRRVRPSREPFGSNGF